MKKIISLVLALSLLLTMTFTSALTANAENAVKTTNIDLTQDVANLFATTGSTTSTTATVEDGKLKVNLSAYERHLTATSYGTKTWFPNYLLAVDGSTLKLTKGSKAIVEVKYKVVEANGNATWGAQIGIGNFNGGKDSNIYVRTYKKHLAADAGKEFTIASAFTVDGNYATKIAFAGGGTIEISSIVVHELPAAYIDDYAVVKYVADGSDMATEFVKKNTAPKTVMDTNQVFDGWYAASDYTGAEVTSITDDTTLYGRYTVKTTNIDLTQDVANLFATTSSTTSTTATVEDGKLKVNLSAYERHLTAQSYGNQTWFPSYLLAVDGSTLKLTKGSKAIVEVKYKVVEANGNADWGAQIGIGNFNGGKGSNIYVRTYKKHLAADAGKEFTIASAFTVDGYYAAKIAFAGGGTIEISSIVVHELPAQYIDEYAAVNYVNVTEETTEFVKKNTAPKTLVKDTNLFEGWFASSDFAGEAVTTITEDITLYAKFAIKTTNIDLTQDVANLFATTGSTTSTTATVEDGKLKVNLSAYERDLPAQSYGNQTWFPNYLLAVDDAPLKLTKGSKAIVEVKYKVVEANENADWGAQIGIGNFNGGKGSNIYVRTYKKHLAADAGKEFTIASAFTVDGNYATKIAFAGGGTIEISSIVVHELSATYIDDYAVVKYIADDNDMTTEFVLKNTNLNTPSKENYKFMGWYDSNNTKITAATEDITVNASWLGDDNVDLTKSVKINGSKADMTPTIPTDSTTPLNVTVEGFDGLLMNKETDEVNTVNVWTGGASVSLKYSDDSYVGLKSDSKYVVNVQYDVTSIDTQSKIYHPQIAIIYNKTTAAANVLEDNGSVIMAVKKHSKTVTDATISCVVSGVSSNALRLAFDGQGKFAIKSITVTEMIGNVEMSLVTYKDSTTSTDKTAVAENGTAIADLPRTLLHNFGGWYNGEEKVTTVSGDVTLTAKWFDKYDVTMNGVTDLKDIVRIKKALVNLNTETVYDIDRDNAVSATDVTALRKNLLGIKDVVLDETEVAGYTVVSGDQQSFLTAHATESLVDSIDGLFDVNLSVATKMSPEKNIVVGIKGIDETVLKSGALENLTGVKGDVYGLDDYKIFLYEGNIYIEAGSDYATAYAVNKFVGFLEEYKFIPNNFELTGKYNGTNDLFGGFSYVWGDEFGGNALNTENWDAPIETKNGPAYKDDQMISIFGVSDLQLTAAKISGTLTVGDKEFTRIDYDESDGEWNLWTLGVNVHNTDGTYSVSDGLLTMNAMKTSEGFKGSNIFAKHNFTYGIMEARIMFGSDNGAAATFWSRSKDKAPTIPVNEFDFAENFGAEKITPNLHTWKNAGKEHINHSGEIDYKKVVTPAPGEKFSDTFHHIALVWTPEKVTYYLDGVVYLEQDITDPKWSAFNEETYLILGLNVPEGSYAQYSEGVDDYSDFNVSQKVDYIRIYQLDSQSFKPN